MRKLLALPLLCFFLLATGCNEPTGSERRTLVGPWTSSNFAAATVQMTVTEVARSVNGAGSWVSQERAAAFRVSGAHAEETVSLLFEFKEMPDVNFLGAFTDANTMTGTLTGGSFRSVPITFVRAED